MFLKKLYKNKTNIKFLLPLFLTELSRLPDVLNLKIIKLKKMRKISIWRKIERYKNHIFTVYSTRNKKMWLLIEKFLLIIHFSLWEISLAKSSRNSITWVCLFSFPSTLTDIVHFLSNLKMMNDRFICFVYIIQHVATFLLCVEKR